MSINIDDMTYGQLKQINALFYGMEALNSKESISIHQRNIGKYVLVRSRNEGINAGVVVAADETGIVLSECRRVWYHRPADETSWYEGVANSGLRKDSKVSAPVLEKAIIEDYSITICTDVAEKSIREIKSHAQS